MAKFFARLFSRGSSLNGSRSSLNDTQSQSRTSSSIRTSGSLENLSSYHVTSKELEKNKLHKASWEGNLQKVQRLAQTGNINIRDQRKRTPLHLAIVKGHIDVVRYLVQGKAKLDIIDNELRTPLIKAVLSGNQNPQRNFEICKVLIDGGAGDYINAVDKDGKTALHYAINFGNHPLVELFLSHENCDPNLQDQDQMTPLHLAVKRNSLPIVQSLLSDQHDQQADPNITNRNEQTPLHLAATVGYVEIVRHLLRSDLQEPCDPTIVDSQQLTALALAKANHQEICVKLIEEYQQTRFKPNLQKLNNTSIHEQISMRIASQLSMTPAANLQHDRDDTSEESMSMSTSKPSKSLSRRIKRQSDQWSDDNNPSIGESKLDNHGLQSLFKTNPLQPNETKKNTPSTLSNLLTNNPLQTKTKSTPQPANATSSFAIGPVFERVDSDNTSTSMSLKQPVKPIQPSTQNKPAAVLQPASNTKSWSDDTTTAPPVKKQEPRGNSWDTSVSDDDPTISKTKEPASNLHNTQVFSTSVINVTSSDTDDDDDNSVSTEIRRLDREKPSTSTGVENLVNKQIGNGYKIIGLSEVQSPVSDDSSWSTALVPFDQGISTKGVQNLIKPIKTNDSTWDDDSRPLSTDSSQRLTTGVENLAKIIETIRNSKISSNVTGKLLVSSISSDIDEWSSIATNENKVKRPRDFTSSSLHDVQELKENIKRLERQQDDTRELKHQLQEMETKKNNFEKLYQKNDQMLRDIEDQLQQEKSEKHRLESTTQNLHTELKIIKEKLQNLEDDKDRLNQRCLQLKEERDKHDDKLRTLESTSFPPSSSFRDDDFEKIKIRHREEIKVLSAENDDLHHRTRKLQSDLELHRDSLDVTVRYKIELEKAVEQRNFFEREFDRLKTEKESIEQEKFEYKSKYDGLQDEIRVILFDRSKLEQKLTGELHEHFQAKQRSTDDSKKSRTEIEQLNIQLADAEARLLALQKQNESLLTSRDREIKTEFESLTQRLTQAQSNQSDAEQRYHQQPLMIQTSTVKPPPPLSSSFNPSSNILHHQNFDLNKTFPVQQTYLIENSRQIRSNTERMKSELDRLRQDFDQLVLNYEPKHNVHQQTQLHSQIETFRQFYEQEFRQRQLIASTLSTRKYSMNEQPDRLPMVVDQHLQTIPRQASALLTINTTNNGPMSSIELFRKYYHV